MIILFGLFQSCYCYLMRCDETDLIENKHIEIFNNAHKHRMQSLPMLSYASMKHTFSIRIFSIELNQN